MQRIDQSQSWKVLEDRLGQTPNPRHREMIQTLVDHLKAEVASDLDGVLSAFAPDPVFHLWSDGHDVGPKGMDAVATMFRQIFGSGANCFENQTERIIVDDDNVVLEVLTRQLLSGKAAQADGYIVSDEAGFYIMRARAVVIWTFSADAKIEIQNVYISRDMNDIERVDEGDVPKSIRRAVSSTSEGSFTLS